MALLRCVLPQHRTEDTQEQRNAPEFASAYL